jgi:haloacetate dehalogenase
MFRTIQKGPLARLANPHGDSSSAVTAGGSASFKTAEIDVADNKIFYRLYGQGLAILMVHGFPRTSLMWRFLAPKLAGNHTVICVDLRAHGRSGIPRFCRRPLSLFQTRNGK